MERQKRKNVRRRVEDKHEIEGRLRGEGKCQLKKKRGNQLKVRNKQERSSRGRNMNGRAVCGHIFELSDECSVSASRSLTEPGAASNALRLKYTLPRVCTKKFVKLHYKQILTPPHHRIMEEK